MSEVIKLRRNTEAINRSGICPKCNEWARNLKWHVSVCAEPKPLEPLDFDPLKDSISEDGE